MTVKVSAACNPAIMTLPDSNCEHSLIQWVCISICVLKNSFTRNVYFVKHVTVNLLYIFLSVPTIKTTSGESLVQWPRQGDDI